MKASELDELVAELWASDAASALTNRAARVLESQAKAIEELMDAVSHWMVADPKSFLNYTMNDVVRQALASHSKEGEQG